MLKKVEMVNNQWSNYQRQPFAAILMVILQTVAEFIKALWPLILAIFLKAPDQRNLQVLIVIIPPLIVLFMAVAKFLANKYAIQNDNFMLKKGIFNRKEISIPIGTIQAINVEQNWLTRILNLVKVSIDATGAEKSEASLHLHKNTANALRELIIADRASQSQSEKEATEEIVSELTTSELFKLGITANHLETLAILFGLLISFLQNIKSAFEDRLNDFLDQTENNLITSGSGFMIYSILFILMIAGVISFFRTIFKFANFKIRKSEKGFSIESGLINTKEQTIVSDKIQFITWKANWLRKKLPIYIAEYHCVGDQEEQKLRAKIPVMSHKLLKTLVQLYGNEIDIRSQYFTISSQFVLRKTLISIIAAAIIGAVTFYFYRNTAFLVAGIPVISYVRYRLIYKKFRLYIDDQVMHVRKGAFGDAEILLRWEKVQHIRLVQSLYQQRNQLASIHLFTSGGKISIPYLNLKLAQNIRDFALFKVENR